MQKTDKNCTLCSDELLMQCYTKYHGQTFSINQLDVSQGHYRRNVRLTCQSCNYWYKLHDDDTATAATSNDFQDFVDHNDSDDGCQYW